MRDRNRKAEDIQLIVDASTDISGWIVMRLRDLQVQYDADGYATNAMLECTRTTSSSS